MLIFDGEGKVTALTTSLTEQWAELLRVGSLQKSDRLSTGNTHKFGEVRTRGFRAMQADRQTDIQTHSSQYIAPSRGAKYLSQSI